MRGIDFIIYPMLFVGLYTAIYFLYVYFEKYDDVYKVKTNPLKYYSVTVIVPCFNEEKTVLKTLKSLSKLNYPKDKLHIMVVDDGSTDKTYEISKKYADSKECKFQLSVLKKKNGGKYTALNYGLERCKTEIVGALDADSFVTEDALKNMISSFDEELVMAVTPSMRIHDPKSFLQRIQAVEYLMGLFLRKVFSLLSGEHVTPGPFTMIRKEFFDKHGNYRKAHHTEDIEVALRIQSLGYKIDHARNAPVYTTGPSEFDVLFKQRVRWYYGFIENVLDYKHLFDKKYGLLGTFILPVAFLSVFMVLISSTIALTRFISQIKDGVQHLIITNFDIFNLLKMPKIDVFYFNIDAVVLLSLLSLFIGFLMVLFAKKVSEEKLHIKFSYFLFLGFYWILFTLWWGVSIFYKLIGKKTKWWHKSGK